MLKAPTLVVRHAASRERLGETLLEDPRGHGLREGVTAATVFYDKARDVRWMT